MRRADLEGLRALLDPDVELWIAGHPPIRGREAFVRAVDPVLRRYAVEQSYREPDISVDQVLAVVCCIEVTRMAPHTGGENVVREERSISILRKSSSGRWLFFRGMNFDLATPRTDR